MEKNSSTVLNYGEDIRQMINALQAHYNVDEAEAVFKAIRYTFYEHTYWNR